MSDRLHGRLLRGALIAAIGVIVLTTLGWLLGGLVANAWQLAFCALTTMPTAARVSPAITASTGECIAPAITIVGAGYLGVAVGEVTRKLWSDESMSGFEPIGLIVWAVIFTSWWLVPSVAWLLRTLSKPR